MPAIPLRAFTTRGSLLRSVACELSKVEPHDTSNNRPAAARPAESLEITDRKNKPLAYQAEPVIEPAKPELEGKSASSGELRTR